MTRFMVFLFLAGCGWMDEDKGAPSGRESLPAPAVVYDIDSGDYLYTPEYIPLNLAIDETEDMVVAERCGGVHEGIRSFSLDSVDSKAISFVYKTVNFSSNSYDLVGDFPNASHVHLVNANILSSGSDFSFISWISVYVDLGYFPHQIVWGRDLETEAKKIEVEVDGSIDLAPYLPVTIFGQVRGKSPDSDTTLTVSLLFRVFEECSSN